MLRRNCSITDISPNFGKKDLANPRQPIIYPISFIRTHKVHGGISKWLKGADCKSVRVTVRRFKSCSHHHFDNQRVTNLLGKNLKLSQRVKMAKNTPKTAYFGNVFGKITYFQ